MGSKVTSANKAPTKVTCKVCGKTLTRAQSLAGGMGAKCKHLQGTITPTKAIAHKKRFTLSAVPLGYVKTASTHKYTVVPAKNNGLAVSVSKFVTAFGGDKGYLQLAHPITRFWYVQGNKARYQHPWVSSKAGMQALATNNYASAPKAPTKAQLIKAIKAGTKFSA